MRILLFTIIILSTLCTTALSAQDYRTQALSPEIQTIGVSVNGDKNRNSIIQMNSGEYINISFDRLSDDSFHRLRYRIFHCSANWNKSSQLSEMEYIDGFNDNTIDDFAASRSTTVDYTNFNLQIPNRDVSLRLSGNYVVEIYEEDEPDNVLLHACFSVLDKKLNIGYRITSNTDIDSNREHQQLLVDVLYPNFRVNDPLTELKVFATQNNRIDTRQWLSKPTFVGANKISFEHNRSLIFEAGNEYRRFETSSYKYNGMNVAHIEYDRPYYAMYLNGDKVRAKRTYVYDQDQNGRYYIRNLEGDDSNVDGDYFITHFSIPMHMPLPQDVYVNGDFTNNTFTDFYKMQYDYERREYFLLLRLKQGLYNYQYLTEADGKFSPALVEGNYHEAENEYQINVYHRAQGQRYDAFIGTLTCYSRSK